MQISRNILANTKIMDWDEAIITNDISHSWTILTCLSDMHYVHRIALEQGSNIYLVPEACFFRFNI